MSWHIIAATAAAVAIRYKNYEPEERPASKPFIGACPDALEMSPSPIEPSWILAGDPQARVAAHSKADDECAATGVWDCTAGSFRWFFGWDETVVILEGEVHVTAEDGTQRTLRAGDRLDIYAVDTFAQEDLAQLSAGAPVAIDLAAVTTCDTLGV